MRDVLAVRCASFPDTNSFRDCPFRGTIRSRNAFSRWITGNLISITALDTVALIVSRARRKRVFAMVEQNARVICVPPPDKFGERNGDAGIGKKKLIGKMIRNKKKKEKERSSSYLHTVTAKMLSLYYLSLLSSILVPGLVLKDIRKKKKKKIGALYAPVARPTNCLSL